MNTPNLLPPVVLLGGDANALSVARSLAGEGVTVYATGSPNSPQRFSRSCRWIPLPANGDAQAAWIRFLLGSDSEFLRGAVLLSCCDEGIELIALHRDELAKKFVLDISNRDAQLCMLNKLDTYRAAVAARVPTPRFWRADSREKLLALRDELCYPIIVKPLLSHVFASRIGKGKFVRAITFDEALAGFQSLNQEAGIEVMLVEAIPGPDDRLCSYYTYLDEAGRPLVDFTKRIIRRFPANRGPACYHVTDWNPEVKELALRLFEHVGLCGLANAEFKRDPRDGRLKLIECNARFTAANCVVAEAGLDLASFVYRRLTGQSYELPTQYRTGLHLWDPALDFRAFLELRRSGQLTWGRWIASLLRPKILPYFRWSDPRPSVMCAQERLAQACRPLVKRFLSATTRPDRRRAPAARVSAANAFNARVGSGVVDPS